MPPAFSQDECPDECSVVAGAITGTVSFDLVIADEPTRLTFEAAQGLIVSATASTPDKANYLDLFGTPLDCESEASNQVTFDVETVRLVVEVCTTEPVSLQPPVVHLKDAAAQAEEELLRALMQGNVGTCFTTPEASLSACFQAITVP